eukprot:PITA_25239
MAFYGLRLEYALEGSLNYIAWKDRMEAVLEGNGLKEFIDQEIPKPTSTNAQEFAEWKKCVAKVRRIILEGVRDHIVLSLHGKDTPFSMWKTLKDLYQNRSDQRKLALKDKLQRIKMEKGDTISTYPNKLTTYIDELDNVGITSSNDDMEEIRRSTRDGSSSKNDDEENLALASKETKGKGKFSHFKSNSSHGGNKGDMSKVRCFNCHNMGHYVTNFPSKKSKKRSSEGSKGEALASQLEMDFTLIACMVSSMMGFVCYLDSGASFHMTDDKKLFSALEEKDLKMHIEMGDNGRYSVSGVGTVAFQREHGAPITLKNVVYVPGLKKNLVSVAMLEDKGYDVVFSKGKAFLRHIDMGQTKRIGIRVKNLYKLEVDYCAALSTKEELVQSQDIDELWHRRLGHFVRPLYY